MGGRKERESGDKVSKGGKKKLKRRGDRPGVTQTSLSTASTHQMYSQLSREERSSGFSCNKNRTRLTLTILAAEEIPALCSLRLRHNTHNLKLTVKEFFARLLQKRVNCYTKVLVNVSMEHSSDRQDKSINIFSFRS